MSLDPSQVPGHDPVPGGARGVTEDEPGARGSGSCLSGEESVQGNDVPLSGLLPHRPPDLALVPDLSDYDRHALYYRLKVELLDLRGVLLLRLPLPLTLTRRRLHWLFGILLQGLKRQPASAGQRTSSLRLTQRGTR